MIYPLLDVAYNPVEDFLFYGFGGIIACVAITLIGVIGLTIFFIIKNKNKKKDTENENKD